MFVIFDSFFLLDFKVSFSAGAAAFHRRHLMVWKIFAPRFMFEAVAFLFTVPSLIAGLMFFNRIDGCLSIWFQQLNEDTSL